MISSGSYWEERFSKEGKIWGESPSKSAYEAIKYFHKYDINSVLVPGSGYGRNTKLFSSAGFKVTGVEISKTAFNLAKQFDYQSQFYNGTVLNMSFVPGQYDAIYCFNVLHLFHQHEREQLIQECASKLKQYGIAYFIVFSNEETSFGQGKETEPDTFESKPGRPAHYFTEDDLRKHFHDFEIIKIGTIHDPEDHGGKPHIHILRHIIARKV
jgi:SAM-dependent methyltransferase